MKLTPQPLYLLQFSHNSETEVSLIEPHELFAAVRAVYLDGVDGDVYRLSVATRNKQNHLEHLLLLSNVNGEPVVHTKNFEQVGLNLYEHPFAPPAVPVKFDTDERSPNTN